MIGYLRLALYVIAGLALLAVGHAWRERGRTIEARDATILQMTTDAATLTEARDQCLASVEIQNTAIADLRARGEAEQRRADAARAEADRIGAEAQRRASGISGRTAAAGDCGA